MSPEQVVDLLLDSLRESHERFRAVVRDLDGRTTQEALDAGVPPKQVWAAVWRQLELPDTER